MKTRHCDECRHMEFPDSRGPDELSTVRAFCHKSHSPRFYQPKSINDPTWGYKRRCADYEEKK